MADFVYDRAKPRLLGGISDAGFILNTHTFKCALMKESHTPDKAAHEFWSDISADEISGGGYTAGGKMLTTHFTRVGALAKFDADDIVYTTLSPEFRYAVIYDDTHASKALVACLDFLTVQRPNASPVTIEINASGVLNLIDG